MFLKIKVVRLKLITKEKKKEKNNNNKPPHTQIIQRNK